MSRNLWAGAVAVVVACLESTFDCEPYEPGVSEIRRRFSRRHSFNRGGRYEIRLTLKRGGDIIASARTSITVQGG